MSTKPDTDTGWSKADLVSRAAVNKILYDGYQNHLHDCTNSVRAAEFVHGLQKAVTALPPSDFEQLIQLRKQIEVLANTLKETTFSYHVEAEHKEGFAACQNTYCATARRVFNEALAHKEEKS